MRKIFLLFAIAGIFASYSEDEVYIPDPDVTNIANPLTVNPNPGVVGQEARYMIIIDDVPKNSDWKVDFYLNEQLIKTESLKSFTGNSVLTVNFTPVAIGNHRGKACLTNGKGEVCREITFDVMGR